jgi:soluble P-type ATPase
MLRISVPGGRDLALQHLVLDYNGTLALDGEPLPGVVQRIEELADSLEIHILTADTHGTVRAKFEGLPVKVQVVAEGDQDKAKLEFVESLGAESVAATGNGLIDALMLRRAALGVAVIGKEGASPETVSSADVVVTDIHDALDLLLRPLRLTATLRI